MNKKELRQTQKGLYDSSSRLLKFRSSSYEDNKTELKKNEAKYDSALKEAQVFCRKYIFKFNCPIDITKAGVKWTYNQCWLLIHDTDNPDTNIIKEVKQKEAKNSTKTEPVKTKTEPAKAKAEPAKAKAEPAKAKAKIPSKPKLQSKIK